MSKPSKIQTKQQQAGQFSQKLFNIKATDIVDEDNRIIEVKFSSFGNKDSDDDILIRGCFAKSITERGPESNTNRKIAFVWQHDIKDPIGRVLSIWEAEDGAYARIQLSDPDAVPNAKRALSQLKDGTLNQFSFGFSYVWDKIEYDEAKEAYIVKEVLLYEISVVTLGANEMTELVGFTGKDMKSWLLDLQAKDEETYNQLKQLLTENEAGDGAGQDASPTLDSTLKALSKIKIELK